MGCRSVLGGQGKRLPVEAARAIIQKTLQSLFQADQYSRLLARTKNLRHRQEATRVLDGLGKATECRLEVIHEIIEDFEELELNCSMIIAIESCRDLIYVLSTFPVLLLLFSIIIIISIITIIITKLYIYSSVLSPVASSGRVTRNNRYRLRLVLIDQAWWISLTFLFSHRCK